MISKRKMLLALATSTIAIGSVAGVISICIKNNSDPILVTDDEQYLVGSKSDQKTVPYYVDLTKWMYENKVNPNTLKHPESLQYFDEKYNDWKKSHPFSSLSKYEESVKNDLAYAIDSIPADASNVKHHNNFSNNVAKLEHPATKNLPAYKNGVSKNINFTPDQIVGVIDLICTTLEEEVPEYRQEIQFINSVIDMIVKQEYTGKIALEKVVDATFLCLEKYFPSLQDVFFLLNSSIDVAIMNGYDKETVCKEVNGIIDIASQQCDAKYQILFNIAKTTLDILINFYCPDPTPSPMPTPSQLVLMIEYCINQMMPAIIHTLPEYVNQIEMAKDVIFNILNCDWNDSYCVAHTFDSIFDFLNVIKPEYRAIWFVLNNSLDLIVLNNFDRLTVWNQLNGILNLAKSQLPQYANTIDTMINFVNTVCSNPNTYDNIIAAVKLFLSGEWKKIIGSLYTLKMLAWAAKCVYNVLTPSLDMWWYGQGGDNEWSGTGYYGYLLSKKVTYNNSFPWKKVQTGDTVYEEAGVNYIGGHSGLIDGIYYDIAHNELYVKGVEPYSPDGVEASVWDNTRIKSRDTHLAHPTKATESQKESAIAYAYSQIGHPYVISVAEKPTDEELKNNTAGWYCSELTNYSYWQAGYNLIDYSYANKFRNGIRILNIIKAIYYDIGYFDGSRNFLEIPGDMNFLDIFAIGCGMVSPREINSSNLINDYFK